ncbi:MAG: hypothetical protein JNL08_09170 [Planctomycetes bacterium]|nr:hypothetical protein [Planctomycetota bacterium]
MRVPGRPPVLLDVVEEHFDELDWLWEHRDANVFTPDWTLADLAWCEQRAEAHLDGLRLAELHGIDLALARLAGGEPGATLAATRVLCAEPSGAHLDPVRATLRRGDPPAVDGVRRALRHHLPDALRPLLHELAAGDDALRAAAALDVLAFRREGLPPFAPHLLVHEVRPATCLALAAAARAAHTRPLETALDRALADPEPAVRRSGLSAAAHIGWAPLLQRCREAAARGTDPDPDAVALLGAIGEPDDEATLRACLARPELAATAVLALGALGRVTAVPLLLDLLADAKLGVPAAKAYRRLTGSDAAFGAKALPPSDDGSEDLPPAPDAARADWQRRAASMPVAATWQHGQPIPTSALPTGFDTLPLDCRRDVYLRLRTRRLAVPDLELEALALQQRR